MKEAQRPFWQSALYIGVPAGILFGVLQGIFTASLFQGVVGGIFFAVLFGAAMAWFLGSRMVAQQTEIDLPAGETVEYEGGANHFLNKEARGGRLYLTNRRLIFQPHSFNLQGEQAAVARDDIAGASPCRTLGVVPNGIKVKHRDGSEDRFVVSDRSEWLRRLAPA